MLREQLLEVVQFYNWAKNAYFPRSWSTQKPAFYY